MAIFNLKDHGGGFFELSFDQPDSKANVFTEEALREFDQMVTQLVGRKDIKSLTVTSPKQGIFVAGADINLIKSLDTIDRALEGCSYGQQAIHRFSKLPFEKVAAINGACLGGGFELALACDKRVASDDKSVKIGLPEVNLGVLPGFGGSVRLPKLVRLSVAMDMILSGKQLDGVRALKSGCVDAVLPYQDFNARALAWSKANLGKAPRRPGKTFVDRVMESAIFRPVMFNMARKTVQSKTKGKYPAPFKILDLLAETWGMGIEEGLKREARAFSILAVTQVSKQLIGLFQLAESVKKHNGAASGTKEKKVERAAVLGAGVMGGGIAWAFANKDIPVRMKDISWDGVLLGWKQAGENFGFNLKKKRMTKGQYLAKMAHITGALDYSGFGTVDLVVEAVVENMDVKKKVLAETEKHVPSHAVLCSNTSSLSITEMQSVLARPENFGGLHFFNPVNRMPLVEVIAGEKTSQETVATLFEIAKKMGKTPIVVKDGPGFLVNRLLMPYMNEALFLFEEGVSVERIDRVMLEFGMPMGPMRLVDEVGIDVAAKVAKILNKAFGARAQAATASDAILASGRLGKKNGKGLYLYESGKPGGVDMAVEQLVKNRTAKSARLSDSELVQRMIYPMINEAAIALEEGIVSNPGEVDLGMIMGTGFPPFRGGLLRFADSEGVHKVAEALDRFADQGGGDRVRPNQALKAVSHRGGFFKK